MSVILDRNTYISNAFIQATMSRWQLPSWQQWLKHGLNIKATISWQTVPVTTVIFDRKMCFCERRWYQSHVKPLSPFSQFSDNGLVHFQSVSENEQYLLPAPLATGFPSNMNVSLLAVFWDDADLTFGDGQLIYQVRCPQGSLPVFFLFLHLIHTFVVYKTELKLESGWHSSCHVTSHEDRKSVV